MFASKPFYQRSTEFCFALVEGRSRSSRPLRSERNGFLGCLDLVDAAAWGFKPSCQGVIGFCVAFVEKRSQTDQQLLPRGGIESAGFSKILKAAA